MDPSAVDAASAQQSSDPAPRRVLNAGCGQLSPLSLHPAFQDPSWIEVRLDIDERVRPDLVASICDMNVVADASFDAIWCSHNLEHLYGHEIDKALAEFQRVLKPDGFALIACPDLEAIAELIVRGRAEEAAYNSAMGPITALDMLFGHSGSIAKGNLFMAHNTGFTADRLGRLLVESGFVEALVVKGPGFDLWALALMPQADRAALQHRLRDKGLNFFD
jgi:predicted SAM-dependent methyltransferase